MHLGREDFHFQQKRQSNRSSNRGTWVRWQETCCHNGFASHNLGPSTPALDHNGACPVSVPQYFNRIIQLEAVISFTHVILNPRDTLLDTSHETRTARVLLRHTHYWTDFARVFPSLPIPHTGWLRHQHVAPFQSGSSVLLA